MSDTTLNGNAIVHGDARARRFVIIDESGDVVEDLTDRFEALEQRVTDLETP